MLDTTKFQKKLTCICKNIATFEVILKIECDWGCHTVIQCPAFETIEKLWKETVELYANDDQFSYLAKSYYL